MIDDPYKVLGVSPNATQDEIKKAYRKKAKEYHPDLHPNDPEANRKMNEVNQAYDMLTNPDKYEAERRRQQQQQQARNPYGSYGGGQQQQQNRNTYQGSGGWSSDFGGFNFDDFFGFGFSGGGQTDTRPQSQPGDSRDIQQVIYYINNSRYQPALDILVNIPSTGRNARWYYLSALANKGAGNSVRALDQIQKAVQMEPNNRVYQQLLQNYRRSEQQYDKRAQSYNMNTNIVPTLCMGMCVAQLCCNPYRCIRFY